MIMTPLFYKLVLPSTAVVGMLAAADVQPGLLQLGVAGASIGALVVYIRYTSKERTEQLKAHSADIERITVATTSAFDKVCERIDNLVGIALGAKGGGGRRSWQHVNDRIPPIPPSEVLPVDDQPTPPRRTTKHHDESNA